MNKLPLILIIEDDKLLSKMYAEKFKLEGFDTIVAQDGEEGLEYISEKNPSFILLDMMLPKFTGQDVLNQLKKRVSDKATPPIIALTNLAQKEEAQKALELGAKEYLVKAMYTPDQVVEKVKFYLDLD